MVQRLAEGKHKRLAAAVDAVELFRPDGDDGRDIDEGALAACDKAWHSGVRQPRERGHVQVDHPRHCIDIAVEQRRVRPHACVVDEQGDACVLLELGLDGC